MGSLTWVFLTLILLGALIVLFSGRYISPAARKPEPSREEDRDGDSRNARKRDPEDSGRDMKFETAEELGSRFPEEGRTGIRTAAQSRLGKRGLLHALPRNPGSVYVYWGFAADGLREQLSGHADHKPVLRLDELAPSGERLASFDVPIQAEADNWYVQLLHANTQYQVELGLTSASGHYISLTNAARVRTPSSSLSPLIDQDWEPLPGLNFGVGLEQLSSAALVRDIH